MLDAELKDPITDEALAQAIRDELTAAGEAIGIPPGNVHALPHLAPSGWARRVAVREALAAYPHATHRIAVGGPTTDLVRAEADRVGVRVVEVTPAAATPTGRRAQAVIAAYRLWDPDSGRYAVHHTRRPVPRGVGRAAGLSHVVGPGSLPSLPWSAAARYRPGVTPKARTKCRARCRSSTNPARWAISVTERLVIRNRLALERTRASRR